MDVLNSIKVVIAIDDDDVYENEVEFSSASFASEIEHLSNKIYFYLLFHLLLQFSINGYLQAAKCKVVINCGERPEQICYVTVSRFPSEGIKNAVKKEAEKMSEIISLKIMRDIISSEAYKKH